MPSPHDEDSNHLSRALDALDWEEVDAVLDRVIARLGRQCPEASDEAPARRMLHDLRRKRRFPRMERLAEAWLLSGMSRPQIRRQYAQALVDLGRFAAADSVLGTLISDPDVPPSERSEAQGLVGRLYKQLYVNPGQRMVGGQHGFLRRSLQAYWAAHRQDPADSDWQAINVVALVSRARRDSVSIDPSYPDPADLAGEILLRLDRRAQGSSVPPSAFAVATKLEALVALGRWTEAETAAAEYVQSRGADAFELGSTERQLREVWRLDDDSTGNGDSILPLIRASLLRCEGGAITLSTDGAPREQRAAVATSADARLEAVLGTDRFKTLTWYKNGLDCCASVARIETRSGRGYGTGWLVNGADFAPAWSGTTLLITNKHVISAPDAQGRPYRPAPSRESLRPDDAVVFLQVLGVRLSVNEVVWSSPDLALDATLCRLTDLPPGARPLTLETAPIEMSQPPARVYVIGHPAGRDLELSLHDNLMLACDPRRVHYRAPTEGGSSGSPVFDSENWRVVALHHAGGRNMAMLDGSGTYDANEGIAIDAIRRATRDARI
jgi:hypothetical protein